jgi:Tfp pilus assembly protein PilE
VDPALVDTWSSIFSNVVTGFAAIVVAILAYVGLQTWRKELVGRSQYEAARRLLLLARQFKGAFRQSRGMSTWSNEYAGRPKQDNEKPDETTILNERYARLNRLRPVSELLPQLVHRKQKGCYFLHLRPCFWHGQAYTHSTVERRTIGT